MEPFLGPDDVSNPTGEKRHQGLDDVGHGRYQAVGCQVESKNSALCN